MRSRALMPLLMCLLLVAAAFSPPSCLQSGGAHSCCHGPHKGLCDNHRSPSDGLARAPQQHEAPAPDFTLTADLYSAEPSDAASAGVWLMHAAIHGSPPVLYRVLRI